jgi:hypothetical protein
MATEPASAADPDGGGKPKRVRRDVQPPAAASSPFPRVRAGGDEAQVDLAQTDAAT